MKTILGSKPLAVCTLFLYSGRSLGSAHLPRANASLLAPLFCGALRGLVWLADPSGVSGGSVYRGEVIKRAKQTAVSLIRFENVRTAGLSFYLFCHSDPIFCDVDAIITKTDAITTKTDSIIQKNGNQPMEKRLQVIFHLIATLHLS